MASQSNVFTTVSAVTWSTDKCRIATGNSAVTYNVTLAPAFVDTIYSGNVQIPADETHDVYVGVGNKITINGANFTASEVGTTSSGILGVGVN